MSSTKLASHQGDNNNQIETPSVLHPSQRAPHDKIVSFEEYHYYAQKTRAEENASVNRDVEKRSILNTILHRKKTTTLSVADGSATEKRSNEEEFAIHLPIADSEWNDASRLMRTATAGSCFYLITTDILGPYGVGYVNLDR
jgi:hypothetical protein